MSFEFDLTITLSLVLAIGTILFTWFRTRQGDVDERFKSGTDRMDRHANRLTVLEQKITVLPDKDDMHSLQIEMAKMTGALGQMQAVMEGNAKIMDRLETIVTRHEDHLLNGK